MRALLSLAMASKILGSLHTIEPRESAGAKTTARYRFQTNLAIEQICDLIEQGITDFAILIEHLDDITVIHLEPDPKFVLIQAKARSAGSWTITNLTKSEKDKPGPSSIVAKLYQSSQALKNEDLELRFISNAPYSLKLSNGKKCSSDAIHIAASELHLDEIKKLNDALDIDYAPPRSPDIIDVFAVKRTTLSHQDSDSYVIGRITKILENDGPHDGAVTALYKTLYIDLVEKSSRSEKYSSTEDLIKNKGITRDEVIALFKRSKSGHKFSSMRPTIESDLRAAGVASLEQARILSSCNAFIASRAQGQLIENRITDAAKVILDEDASIFSSSETIIDAAKKLSDRLSKNPLFEDHNLFSASLVIVSEYL
jgi:hypothetical protein